MIQLFDHQRRAVSIARDRERYAFLWEPGSGKTHAILAVVADAKDRGFQGATLVLCPKSIMHTAWAADAKHHPLTCRVVWSTKPSERKKLIAAGADVFVTNYETFKKHRDDFLKAGVRRLVIDESSKIKAFDTQISRACHAFSDQMDSVYVLSGTPAPNNETEYWSQIRCVDRSLFGSSFWQFAYRYFVPLKRTIGDKERIIGWRQRNSERDAFLDKLRSVSWSLTKAECLDLPEQTDIVRDVELGDRERTVYTSILESCRADLAGGRSMHVAASAASIKLRQVLGGAVYVGERIETIGTAKLDALRELLDELGDRQAIIWAEFTAEIDRICANLPGCGRIDGSVPLTGRTSYVEQFQAGALRYLVCHPAAAGHGITLTAASHAIYYSHGFSYENYRQSRDRIHRAGQTKPCTYWHLIAPDTIDERIMKCLQNKGDAHEAIFDELGIETAEVAAV